MDKGPNNQPFHILLIENNEQERNEFCHVLTKSDIVCDIIECEQGEDALALIEADCDRFDLVYAENLLPGMSGVALCEILKTRSLKKAFMIATGNGSEKLVVDAFHAGVDDYLIKGRYAYWQVLPMKIKAVLQKHQNLLAHEQAEKSLEESEKRIRTLVEAADDSILLTDMNHNTLLCNPAFYRSIGYSPQEMERVENRFIWIHPEDKATVQQFLKETKSLGKAECEYRIKHKQGHWLHRMAKAALIFNEHGEAETILTIIRDVTKRKSLEKELRQAKDQAEAANYAKSIFLANMSHEIRTPLNAILGFSTILEKWIVDEKPMRFLTSIQSSGKLLMALINDILDLSKIEAGKLELDYSLFPFPLIFEEVERIFFQQIADKKLDFSIELDPELPPSLLLDKDRFLQVMVNLIGNAIKFTDKGSIKIEVYRMNSNKNQWSMDLMIAVKDTGIGISKENQLQIFDAFEQQKGQAAAQYGGTGLGLAITKKLVETMGGTIQVNSELGKGSEFQIILKDVDIGSLSKTGGIPQKTDPSPEKKTKVWTDKKTTNPEPDIKNALSLLRELEQSTDTWNTLVGARALKLRAIEKFSLRVQSWGKEHHYPALSEWGHDLHVLSSSCDIEELKECLTHYPKFVEVVRKSSQ